MRSMVFLGGAILFVTLTAPARADESANAIADKAIKAMGGAKLTAAHAASWKTKGTITVNGEEIPFTAQWTIQGDKDMHIDSVPEVNGAKLRVYIVVNATKGWASLGGVEEDMDKDRLDEEHERAYLAWLTNFVPLHNKSLKLSTLPEIKIGSHAAVGLKIERRNYRPVQLYFDKTTGLLLKAHMHVKDMINGTEAEQDIYFKDYKKQNGIPHPTKVVFRHDDSPYIDATIWDFKLAKKVPAKVFEKP
jgi:hypothetical protein